MNDDKVGLIDNLGREADRKDGPLYPDLVYILSCKQNADIMTEFWGLCLCYSNKNKEKRRTTGTIEYNKTENSLNCSLVAKLIPPFSTKYMVAKIIF